MEVTSTDFLQSNDVPNMAVNPDSTLEKDDFLKLLLTELQYQDPTAPMDTDKILTQTSQLATLETQQNTNKVLEDFSSSLNSMMNSAAIASIGKMAKLTNSITFDNSPVEFNLTFSEDVNSGTIYIKNDDYNVVRTISLDKMSSGDQKFIWDGKDDNGNIVQSGNYTISAIYNENLEAEYGSAKIEAVKFDNGEALLKIGANYVPFDRILEIY